MLAFDDGTGPAGVSRDTTAFCHTHKKQIKRNGKRWIMSPDIGYIHFYKRQCHPCYVVHECVHAALFYLRRIVRKEDIIFGPESKGKDLVCGIEEDLCAIVSELTRQCNIGLYATGIWKDVVSSS